MKKLYPIAIALLALALSGCLERKEEMTISADGSVQTKITLSGDKGDIFSGLSHPQGNSWTTRQWTTQQKDKTVQHYQATARFSNLQGYTEAMSSGQNNLKIQQSLKIESKGNKTFYRFRRVYMARDWQKYDILKKSIISQKLSDEVGKKGLFKMTKEKQEKFLAQLSKFEQQKRLLQLKDALGHAMVESPNFPAKKIDLALKEVAREFSRLLAPSKIRELLKMDSARLGIQLQVLQNLLDKREEDLLQKIFLSHSEVDFRKHLKKVRHQFQLTEDLLDESLQLHLALPGRIIFTNGTQVKGNQVKWKFDGKNLAGQQVVFEVVSVLE